MNRTAKLRIDELRRLLRIEYEAEKEALTRITNRMELSLLSERGWAWWPLRIGRYYFNSLNQRVVEVERNSDTDIDHEFEYGRSVQFFTASGTPGDTPRRLFGGTVRFVDGDRMCIAIPDNANLELLSGDGGRAGVMLSFDETTYRVMFETLDSLESATGRLSELRDAVYGDAPLKEMAIPPIGLPFLNNSQQEAVNHVIRAKDVAVVHGPPGTGKTTTLVEAVYQTLHRESQVMVCAQSNKAVDWICLKLAERGLNVLRLGNPSRVDDCMLSSTYERRFEAHPDYPTLWSIRQAMRQLYAAKHRGAESWHQKMDRLKDRATALEVRINADIFNSVHVIASTLTGSASALLRGMRFGTVFIDEAAQAMEAASWIPARLSSRIIFAGDHCQLPPTVKSFEAMRGGLSKSLMETVVERHPECVSLLTVQYRMHSDIMRFPSEYFYDGQLSAAPQVADRSILDLDRAIEWVDTSATANHTADDISNTDETADNRLIRDFSEAVTGIGCSRFNPEESRLTIETLRNYVSRIGLERLCDEGIDFAIISPYRAQVRHLRTLLKRETWYKRLRRQITVNTIDGFQGQERDVVLISLVRNNDRGDIGFLRDLRRINVAITRARLKLIIVGDSTTLTAAHPFYRRLKRHIDSLG